MGGLDDIHYQFSPYMVLVLPYLVKIDSEYHPSSPLSPVLGTRVIRGSHFLMTFMILQDSYMEPTCVGFDSVGHISRVLSPLICSVR